MNSNRCNLVCQSKKVYILYNVNPEFDISFFDFFSKNLQNADFVITFYAFDTAYLRKFSHVLIPISTFYEASGSYLNITGLIQTVDKVSDDFSITDEMSGWVILLLLAKVFSIDNFMYNTLSDVRDDFNSSGFLRSPNIVIDEICSSGFFNDSLKVEKDVVFKVNRLTKSYLYKDDFVVHNSGFSRDLYCK
jgi:NADH dehydrogenase/NADH:ubiquinone oxidoreductase subunit G